MGLEGTLRVFSLTDIFQMLGLQRKTGVLAVEGEDDTITISFLGGQVVAAESEARRLENRLGNLLLRAGYVTQEQLDHVLAMQKDTQQRMGFLLVRERLVDPQELREALRLQISRIVYSAFRWNDGKFRFSQEGMVDYDADHMAPVSTDTILMEAAQMVDEWPLLEKKIGDVTSIYRRAQGVEELRLVTGVKNPPEGTLSVSKAEAETWRWTDGQRTIGEVMERAFLSDFEVLKGTADLLGRHLIEAGALVRPEEPSAVAPAPDRGRGLSVRAVLLWGVVAALAAGAAYLIPRNPANLFFQPPVERRREPSCARRSRSTAPSRSSARCACTTTPAAATPARWKTSSWPGSWKRTPCATRTAVSTVTSCAPRTASSACTGETPPVRSIWTSRSREASRPWPGSGRRGPPTSPSLPASSWWNKEPNKELSLLDLA